MPFYSVRMKRLLLFALVTIVPSHWALAAGVPIIQKYKPGQCYKQQVTITQESSVSTGVTESRTKTNIALDWDSTVAAAQVNNSKGTVVEVRYKKASMTVDQNGVVSRFESAAGAPDDASGNVSYSLMPLVGLGYNVMINDTGLVDSVVGAEQTVNALAGTVPMVAVPFREMFGASAMKRIFEQSIIRTPKGTAPSVGDTWPLSQEFSLPGFGKMTATGTYRLVGTAEYDGKQCSEIAISAALDIEPPTRKTLDLQDNDRFDTLSRQMKLSLAGSTMTGTIYFDPELSFPRAINLTQNVNIEAKIPDGTKNVIKMPIKQTMSMRLADVVPVEDVHPQ